MGLAFHGQALEGTSKQMKLPSAWGHVQLWWRECSGLSTTLCVDSTSCMNVHINFACVRLNELELSIIKRLQKL